MRTWNGSRIFSLVLALLLLPPIGVDADAAGPAPAAPRTMNDWVDTRLASSTEALQRFTISHSFDDLRAALELMDGTISVNELTSQNFRERRLAIVGGWARILTAIEQSYDPTFDPKLLLACPSAPSGLMPCADPSGIADPTARAKYAAELSAFHQRSIQEDLYQQLVRLDLRAMSQLDMSIKLFRKLAPARTPSDYATLATILKQAGMSEQRRAQIETWLTVWYTLAARCTRVRPGTDPAITLTLTNRSATDRPFAPRLLIGVTGRAFHREIPVDERTGIVKSGRFVKANSITYVFGSSRKWTPLTSVRHDFGPGWYELTYCDGTGTCSDGLWIKLE